MKANEEDPLARTYKIGVWYDSESFADQRFDNPGLPLADPGQHRNARDAIAAITRSTRWRTR